MDGLPLAGSLTLATMRFARFLRGRQATGAVSLAQMSILLALADAGPLTPGQLADRERVQPPTMTRAVDALAGRGLVKRAPHPTDGRHVIVSLTEAGERALKEEQSARQLWLEGKLSQLTAAQRATLGEAAEILDGIAGAPAPGLFSAASIAYSSEKSSEKIHPLVASL